MKFPDRQTGKFRENPSNMIKIKIKSISWAQKNIFSSFSSKKLKNKPSFSTIIRLTTLPDLISFNNKRFVQTLKKYMDYIP